MSLLVSRDCTESISLNADDGQIYTVAYRNKKNHKTEKRKQQTQNRNTQ